MKLTKVIAVAVLMVSTACIGKSSSSARAKAQAKANKAAADKAPEPAKPQAEVPAPADDSASARKPMTLRRADADAGDGGTAKLQAPVDDDPRAEYKSKRPEATQLQTGDVLFVSARTAYARALGSVFPGDINHVGLVFVTSDGPQVVSAGVKLDQLPYDRWLRVSGASRVVAKRLTDASALSDEKMLPLKQFSFSSRGSEYDYALDWGDTSLYASEYVHKAFTKGPGVTLGKKQTLSALGVDAAALKKFGEAHSTTVAPDTEVVTPASMFEDTQLKTVFDVALDS